MKKTYINPQMEVVKMATKQPMLVPASGPTAGGSTSNVDDLLGRDGDDFDW